MAKTESDTDEKCYEIYDVPLDGDTEGFYQQQCWLPKHHKGKHAPATQEQIDALRAEEEKAASGS